MFASTWRSLFFATTIALAACAAAAPKGPSAPASAKNVKVPFATKFGKGNGPHNIVAADKARIAQIKADAKAFKEGKRTFRKEKRANYSFNVTNAAVIYTAALQVGVPPTTYNLIVDTGSSNTWVGAVTPYTPTSSATDTGESVFVSYGSGLVFGEEYLDTVALSDDLVIVNQSIGVAELAFGFDPYDGILGIGPVTLTEGTTDSGDPVPTVTDNLLASGAIDTETIGVYFAPTTETSTENGILTFGGVDESLFTGEISYTSLTTTEPATYYWGVDQSVSYGGVEILPTTAGITDTGTTLIYLATDAYDAYVAATGAVYDNQNTGLLQLSTEQYGSLEDLVFTIGDAGSFSLTPNGQIWPRSLNEYIGGTADSIYLVVSDFGSPSGEGLDFIDGYSFLERFYTVYDTTNSQIGFATTSFTTATTN